MLVAPVAVYASHIFSDVPTSNTYHTVISRLVGAGITGGCGGGKYCPNDAVSRGQMAAFLNRGLGRGGGVAFSDDSWDNVTTTTLVGTVDLQSGGGGGGTGLVLVSGNINVWTDELGVCPCEVQLSLFNPDTTEASPTIFEGIGADGVPTSDPGHPGVFWETNTTASWVFTVPSGTNNTFEMYAIIVPTVAASTPTVGNGFVTGWVSGMQATYLPFGADGGNAVPPSTTQGGKHFKPRGQH
jgi:hypothetical protein